MTKVAQISQNSPLLDPTKKDLMLSQAMLIDEMFPTLEGYIKFAPSAKNNFSERVAVKDRCSLKDYINRIVANELPANQYNFFIDPSTATEDKTIVVVDVDDHEGDFDKKNEIYDELCKDYSLQETLTIRTKTGRGLQYWYLVDTDRVPSFGKNKISPIVLMGSTYEIELVTNQKGKKTLIELPGNYSAKTKTHYMIHKDNGVATLNEKFVNALVIENKVNIEDLAEWENQPHNKMYLTNPVDHPDNISGFTQYLSKVLFEAIKSGTPPADKSNRNNMCLKYVSMGSLYNISAETIAGLIEQYLVNSPQVFPNGSGDTDLLAMAQRQLDWAVNNGIRGQKDSVDVLAPFEHDNNGYVSATRQDMMNKAREVLRVSLRMRFNNEAYRRAFYSLCFNVPGGKFIPQVVSSTVLNDNISDRRQAEEDQMIDIDVTQSLRDISQKDPHWKFIKTPDFNEMCAYVTPDGKTISRVSNSKEYLQYSLSGYSIETDSRYLKQEKMVSGNMIFLCEEPAIKNLDLKDIPKGDLQRVETMWKRWCRRVCDPADFDNDYNYVSDYFSHTIRHMDGEPNAMIFVGRPGSGKSAMMALLRAMLPFGYSANIANQKLIQNDFMALVKLMCIDDMEDLSEDLSALLKALLTGSEFLVNKKFKDMANMIIKMSVVAATNNYDIDLKGLDARRVSAICNFGFVDQDDVRSSLRKDFMFLTRTNMNIENYYFRVLRTFLYNRNVNRNGWFYLSRYQKDRILKGETSNEVVIILANLIANQGHIIKEGKPYKLFKEGAIVNRMDIQVAFDYYLQLTQDPDMLMPIEHHNAEMHKGDNMTRMLKYFDQEYRKEFKTSFGDPNVQKKSELSETLSRTWTFSIPSMKRFKELLALATEKSKTKSAVEQVMDRYSLNKNFKEEIGTRTARLLYEADEADEL